MSERPEERNKDSKEAAKEKIEKPVDQPGPTKSVKATDMSNAGL